MAKGAFDAIMAGLNDAAAFKAGRRDTARRVQVEVPDVKTIRRKLKLSQPEFASTFNVSLATVRNWEQKRRKPEGPALVLLRVVAKHPEAVIDALEPRKGARKRRIREAA